MCSLEEHIYQELRDSVKTGDLLVWEGTSLFARLVSLFTKSSYTHVGLAWVVGGRVLILQANPGVGVEVATLSDNLPVVIFKSPTPLSAKALKVALDQLQEPYSFMNAIRAGFGLRVSNRGFQCVQYVLRVFKANKLKIDLSSHTPKQLVEFFETTLHVQGLKVS